MAEQTGLPNDVSQRSTHLYQAMTTVAITV